MRVETAIGNQIARLRETRQMSLTQLGETLGRYLGRPWSRQAVHQAERGRRTFTAAELAALALALDTSIPALFLADAGPIELPGSTVSAEDYRAILLYAGHDVPMDGVEELIVALHDISEVLSRPVLTRLAKIGQVAKSTLVMAWSASASVRAILARRSRPVNWNSRRIWGRSHTTCRLVPCAAACPAARASTRSPAASMKLTRLRSATSW
jgi:transcriptional regulator with XRE-family HTH domain